MIMNNVSHNPLKFNLIKRAEHKPDWVLFKRHPILTESYRFPCFTIPHDTNASGEDIPYSNLENLHFLKVFHAPIWIPTQS